MTENNRKNFWRVVAIQGIQNNPGKKLS